MTEPNDVDAAEYGEYLDPSVFGNEMHEQLLRRAETIQSLIPEGYEAVAHFRDENDEKRELSLDSILKIESAEAFEMSDDSGKTSKAIRKKGVFSKVHFDKKHAAEAAGVFGTLALATAVIMIRKKRSR